MITHKKYDRAIERLEDTGTEGIGGFYAANNLCVSYLKVGDTEKAQFACDAAVTRIQHLMKKKYSPATTHRLANDYNRLLASALSNRGVINYINDKVEMARDDFEAAIEADADVREAQVNLARLSQTESA